MSQEQDLQHGDIIQNHKGDYGMVVKFPGSLGPARILRLTKEVAEKLIQEFPGRKP